MRRYDSERSERWAGFEHRSGDVVVSTRSKAGTTWMQMVCLTLIHGTPLPAPLALLSPWVDWDVEPVSQVHARLTAQTHRRVIKTHTPLDGVPLHPDVHYIVVGRHPLDVAVSHHHHLGNLDPVRGAELRDRPPTPGDRPPLDGWVDAWIADPRPPEHALDTLAGNVHHLADAWSRARSHPDQFLLVHYAELSADREAVMRRVAAWLEIEIPEDRWPGLVAATSFDAMRRDPTATVPDHLGVLRDPAAFFRSGSVGDGLRLVSSATRRRYLDRLSDLADPDLIRWLHQA